MKSVLVWDMPIRLFHWLLAAHSGEGAWGDMKTGIELAWTSMGEAIDSARSRFK